MKTYLFLIFFFCFSKASQAQESYPRQFQTDYCTSYSDGTRSEPKKWANCCKIHDLYFWAGGVEENRNAADRQLKNCVKNTGANFQANLIYFGVKLGAISPFKIKSKQWGNAWGDEVRKNKLSHEEINSLASKLTNHADLTTEEINNFITDLNAINLITTTADVARKPLNETLPPETLNRLKTLYPNQPMAFILQRLKNADDAFSKWRSFPPYYYQLVSRLNLNPFISRNTRDKSLCVGDAHLENFGFLYYPDKKDAIFSINDFDDAAPCSLVVDALRLYIGHNLVNDNINLSQWYAAYTSGLKNIPMPLPIYLQKLKVKSINQGTQLPKKIKQLFLSNSCSGDYKKLTMSDEKILKDYLTSNSLRLRMACTRTKTSGGSAGLITFVVNALNSLNHEEAFELKPLVTPAPLFNQPNIPNREKFYEQAITTFLNTNFQKYYYPTKLNNHDLLRRPLWAGNEAVDLKDIDDKDLQQIKNYQAYILGTLHSKSNKTLRLIPVMDFKSMAETIEQQWRKDFNE